MKKEMVYLSYKWRFEMKPCIACKVIPTCLLLAFALLPTYILQQNLLFPSSNKPPIPLIIRRNLLLLNSDLDAATAAAGGWMDVLFRQLRTKYPPPPHEQDSKARSTFSRERRSQSWIRRQFSKQMNQNYESTSEGHYPTAVAAAAFAVKSLEDQSRIRDERIWHQGTADANSFTQPNDYTSHTRPQPQPRYSSSGHVSKPNLDDQDKLRAETSEKLPEKRPALVPSIKKKLSFAETTVIPEPEPALPAEKPDLEPTGMIPSMKNPLTPNRVLKKRQDTSYPRIDTPPLEEPPPQIPISGRKKISQNPGRGAGDIDADEWERNEMSRIKAKYDRLNVTLLDWESKNKRKARSQLDKVQGEPEKKKAKAVQHYRNKLERIQSIVEGTRKQAIANRRNEELKVREKANKIRMTGKLPSTCLCC